MKDKDLNGTIEELLGSTLDVMNSGKKEISNIIVDMKDEYAINIIALSKVQDKLLRIIDEVDSLTIEEKRSRRRLVEVSNDFSKFDEIDIKEAYEKTHDLRSRLEIKRQEEKMHLDKRNDLERSLKRMISSIERGEKTIDRLDNIAKYLSGNIKDINETLDDMNKIQLFGIKVIEAQEEERKRISRDIHDGPAQDMANIMLRAEYCEKIIDRDILKARDEIRELKSDVKMTLNSIRKIIYDLRPMSLDDLGLIPTMEKYLKEFNESNNLNIDFNNSGNFSDLNPGIEIAIYRVIQESLNNIKKHAGAKNISIDIRIVGDIKQDIALKIEDDGKGFSDSDYREKLDRKDAGFGLMGMRERIEVLGGKFKIDSKQNIGTVTKVIVPIIEKGRD